MSSLFLESFSATQFMTVGRSDNLGEQVVIWWVFSVPLPGWNRDNWSGKIRCQNVGPKKTAGARHSSTRAKGQLISKCPDEKSVSFKIPTKIFLDFCPEFFCSFMGASWKLFGLPWDLVCNILNKEAYRKPQKAFRKPPGRYNRFQGRNSEIISLVILSKR